MATPFDADASAHATAIADEQATLDSAFARRDRIIQDIDTQLGAESTTSTDATGQARRRMLRQRQTELLHAEQGLIFGRLDALDQTVLHVGRIGVQRSDTSGDPLVVDWRAPAARAFYTATPIDAQGQARRRHIRVRGRAVIGVDDEPLDGSVASALVGEGALLAALAERRTGRMATAAATLQREQDEVVRADARGPLVVQGGPGTGKTVVALHRVAYLLFTHSQLAAQGVLVLGPTPRFLEYIAQVLPALGETAVVSATCDTLVPGLERQRGESRVVAEIKGRSLWQRALSGYAGDLVPDVRDLTLNWDDERYTLDERRLARALASATSGRSHAAARTVFTDLVHQLLTDAVVERQEKVLAQMEEGYEDILARFDSALKKSDDHGKSTGAVGRDVDGVLSEADVARLHEEIATDPGLAATLRRWWPIHDPAIELHRLLGDETLLRRWAPGLTDTEVRTIVSEPPGWSSSDLPLFDALADRLGNQESSGDQGDFLADRASAQRDWIYGHVVIDEAQELSEMQWLMVLRRCPSRSITAVGDIDQAEAPHRHTTWAEAVSAALGEHWTETRLTICYRTPLEVMALTGPVLHSAGSRNTPPRAVRASGIEPWEREVSEADLAAEAARAVKELSERWSGGTVGVVVPLQRVLALRSALPQVPVLSATEAKGLEWDATLLVDAAGIAAEPRGWNGLYVALTRCTQELGQLRVSLP